MMQESATLEVATPTDTTIVMTRDFDVPRRLVWDAMTKPEFVRRWMFRPPGWTWAECDMDVRVGGKFRLAWNKPDGKLALSFSGEHREVTPPAKIVHTERMDMGPSAGACGPGCERGEPADVLVTLELIERGTRTRLTMTISCPTKDIRDAMIASGMEHGMEAGYAQLDALLEEQNRR
jgi:uncharacterized protein YndB with AHSA1/START domain